jgi:hypothetical protein
MMPIGDIPMPGSQNVRRLNAPLACLSPKESPLQHQIRIAESPPATAADREIASATTGGSSVSPTPVAV